MRYQSARPEDIDGYIHSKHWHLQQKLDGVRVHVRIRPDEITLSGASGYSGDLARIRKALLPLTAKQQIITLDGELVEGRYWIFDLPEWGRPGPLWASSPAVHWFRRYHMLNMLWDAAPIDRDVIGLAPTFLRPLEKNWLWDRVLERNLEGVVAKHRDGTYRYDSRTDEVIKIKVTHTVDCIVIDRNTGGKTNASLGLIAKNGTVRHVGNCSMIGKPDVQPGDIVEVKYLYAGSGGNLVQPTVLRHRDDKHPADCTTDQLTFISRDVLPYGVSRMNRRELAAATDRVSRDPDLAKIAGG